MSSATQLSGPRWGVIFGLLAGVAVALAIFVPALMTRPSKPTSVLTATPIALSATLPAISSVALPGPLGGPDVAVDVNTRIGQRAPAFTLRDANNLSYPISPGGGTPTVLVFETGTSCSACVQQLTALQASADSLRNRADAFVVTGGTADDAHQMQLASGLAIPILVDTDLQVTRAYDMLPRANQPQGTLSGVPQTGVVIADGSGRIRIQRVDLQVGDHAGQLLEILRLI